MGGVHCIQTFFGFLDFFNIYKVPNCVYGEYAIMFSDIQVSTGLI